MTIRLEFVTKRLDKYQVLEGNVSYNKNNDETKAADPLPKAFMIERRTSIPARRSGRWLRGEASPDVENLAKILQAFPLLDGRAFVLELARRRRLVKMDEELKRQNEELERRGRT
jgi:hypothetical protein